MKEIACLSFIHRYNKKTDKLEPSITVFNKSELNTIGIIIYKYMAHIYMYIKEIIHNIVIIKSIFLYSRKIIDMDI